MKEIKYKNCIVHNNREAGLEDWDNFQVLTNDKKQLIAEDFETIKEAKQWIDDNDPEYVDGEVWINL